MNRVGLRNLTFLILEDSQAVNGTVSGGTPKIACLRADGSKNSLHLEKTTYLNGKEVAHHYGTSDSMDDPWGS